MENLLLPSQIEFLAGDTPNKGSLVVTPCYHGYGTTLGNSLRRVLLSSLPGAAVEGFKIKGIQHEFTAIDDIKEDAVEIMMNLKQLAVKVFSDDPITLTITKKGAGKVTAKDIKKNSDVEIMNPDHIIAEITGKKEFEMEIIVGRGRGFKPAEDKDRKNYDLGTIVIDSIYTPIKDIGYKVEYTRVGDITNYEKLVLDIETNGTVDPKEALVNSTKILMDHYTLVIDNLENNTTTEEVAEEVVEEKEAEVEEVVEEEVVEKKEKKVKKSKTTKKK